MSDEFVTTAWLSAGAYHGNQSEQARSHAIVVPADGWPILRILCDVQLDSVLDDLATYEDSAPTCPVCARRVPKSGLPRWTR